MNEERKRILIQVGLFIATFITTTLAGAESSYGRTIWVDGYTWNDFAKGLEFSIPLLLILTVSNWLLALGRLGNALISQPVKLKLRWPKILVSLK